MKREFKRRGQRRQAAGGLPRDHHATPVDKVRVHPTRSRRVVRASSRRSASTSSRSARTVGDYEFDERGHRWSHPREYIPPSTPAAQDAMQVRRARAATPWSTCKVTLRRWPVPRRRLLGNGVQDRRIDGLSRRPPARPNPVLLEPIMAVEVVTPEEYMGDVIGDLNSSPWPDRRHGAARQRARSFKRPGAARRDVRLRRRPAVEDPGSRERTRCSSRPTPRSRTAVADGDRREEPAATSSRVTTSVATAIDLKTSYSLVNNRCSEFR